MLDLRDPRFRPLLGMDGAKAMLDRGEDEVLALVDEGFIEGFDISSGGRTRKEARLVLKTITHFLTTGGSRPQEWSDAQLLDLVLPHGKPVLTGKELQRSFNCGSTHVINLITEKLLKIQPGTDWRQGPNGSPLVMRSSVEAFLKTRRGLDPI
jgi:hypothetical protein